MDSRAWRLLDCVLPLAGAGALIIDGSLRAHHGLPPAGYPLAVAAAAPLGFARRAPLTALLAVEAGAIASVAAFRPATAAVALVMVALFTVAVLGGRQRSLVVGAATGVALVLTLLLLDGPIELTGAAVRLLVLLAALVSGDTLRSRRALRAAALLQAEREEHEREAQTSQRLAGERMRIARDLHDTLAHALVAINVRAGVAAHLQESQDPAAALLDIKEVSADALRDLRGTLSLLRESDEAAPVTPIPDLAALPLLIARARASGLDADFALQADGEAVPSPVGQAAFRIVQEALTNVVRHADASSAHVLVGAAGRSLQIEITDDGRGGTGVTEGHGLRGMAERAAALGGHVVTGPGTDGGWRVQASLPLDGRDKP